MKRVISIDIVRGIVMMIMALDHVRDLMHIDSITKSPTDLSSTTPALFFTRWITYLCAPIFVFLAGTSAFISLKKKNNFTETRNYLLKRGFWLIILEFTLVNFAIYFDIRFHTLLFEVIAAIGFGFIILSLLLKLPEKSLGIVGLIIIFCHNLTPLIPFSENSILRTVLMPFFAPSAIPLFAGKVFVMGYPPIPWLGIMLIGFSCGKLFLSEGIHQKKIFIKLGIAALLLFFIIRYVNIYGDSAQWTVQKNPMFTFLSFMNVSKYPPSLVFCLVTLGIMFLLLAFSGQFNNWFKTVASVYGKVPLFYFVVHFYVVHIITLFMLFFQGFDLVQFEFSSGSFGRPKSIESGVSLSAVYLIWIGVVISLYYPCKWYGHYKETHKNWWLSYF